jgi:transcriptional regulator with XRE-family HTH domain
MLTEETLNQIRTEIAKEFHNTLLRYNISRRQLCRVSGVDFKALHKIEIGKGDYYIDSYMKLMTTLDFMINNKSIYTPSQRLYKSVNRYSSNQICDTIEKIVCNYMQINRHKQVNAEVLKSKSRETRYKIARYICWSLQKDFTKETTTYLGSRFNRDHTTYMKGIKVFQNLIDTKDPIIQDYFEIKELVQKQFKLITNKRKWSHNKQRKYKTNTNEKNLSLEKQQSIPGTT